MYGKVLSASSVFFGAEACASWCHRRRRYVDEPTTGLDSVMATNVVQQLKAMASGASAASQNTPKQARQLRTVLCTIHQPSSEIYKLFDKLYFVVDGRAAYFGPTADVPAYFTKLGYPMPVRARGFCGWLCF